MTGWYSVVTMGMKCQAGSQIVWADAEPPARSRPSKAGGSVSRQTPAQNLNRGQQTQGQVSRSDSKEYREENKRHLSLA